MINAALCPGIYFQGKVWRFFILAIEQGCCMDILPKPETLCDLEKLSTLLDPNTIRELVAGIQTVKSLGNGEVGMVFKSGRVVFVRFEITKSVNR